MVDFPKIPILRDHNAIHAKFTWGGGYTRLYLIDHMNDFMLKHILKWKRDTITYADHDSDIIKSLNVLLISSSTD